MVVKRQERIQSKGFKRTGKEWEESVAAHIGKAVDRLDPLETVMMIFCGVAGARAAAELGGDFPAQLASAGLGALSYKLATSGNLVAGASGTVVLASLGLINVWNPMVTFVAPVAEPIKDLLRAWGWLSFPIL